MDPFLFVIPGFLLFMAAGGLWADDRDRRDALRRNGR